ncbi:bacterial sugar transferase (plasmid) [Roseobacter denitrificans OCh 114]|uniref:Bacterial sugar transferase n=2 Tax=Roseobacter denitrificans TaxID=2434 RepID=Q07GG6_ROSDO|nr:bacterial sugar transferase [Roseobacter denitrificans OCh 114]
MCMTLHFAPHGVEIEDQSQQMQRPKAASRPARGIYRDKIKRILDVTAAFIIIPIISPLIALMAAIIAFDGHNPFYSQLRIGRNGRTFRIWKLRTMVQNADDLLEAYLAENPDARIEWDTTQKLKHDPRITFVGRVLRKTSADELPQLLNVLNGTMSLVGPRPMMLCQKAAYPGKGYYSLRPGITGPWQVSDRNKVSFSDRARYDDEYYQTVSFKTDALLLLRTVSVVVRGTGY